MIGCVFIILFVYELLFCFFFKQKTAYEMRISDWSSDLCSSDLANHSREVGVPQLTQIYRHRRAIEGWNLDSILLVLNNIEIHPSPHRTHHGVIQESCSFMLPAIHTLLDCRNLAGNCSIDSCDLAGHRLGGEELVG